MNGERPVRSDFAQRSPDPLLAALSRAARGYAVVRKLPNGVWGAWLVERDGARAVLKCVWDVDWRERLAGAAAVVDALASRGARVPRYLATGYEPDVGTWCLQEMLPGERVSYLTPTLALDVLALNDLQAGSGRRSRRRSTGPSLLARGVAIAGDRFGIYLAYEAVSALRFVAERNPKHLPWRASLARRVLAAPRAIVP